MSNLKEAIRARSQQRKIVSVYIPELGQDVRLQSLTYGETKDLASLDSTQNAHRYLARMIVDENGQRVYTDEESIELDNLSADSIMKLSTASKELSNNDETSRAELIKNSEASPPSTSPSN